MAPVWKMSWIKLGRSLSVVSLATNFCMLTFFFVVESFRGYTDPFPTHVPSNKCSLKWVLKTFPRLLSYSPGSALLLLFLSAPPTLSISYLSCHVPNAFWLHLCVLNNIWSSSLPPTLLLYLSASPLSLSPWQRLWEEWTLHDELLAYVMCFLDRELQFVIPQETNRQINLSMAIALSSPLSHFFFFFFRLHSCLPLSISPSLSVPSMSASTFSLSCILERVQSCCARPSACKKQN